MQAIKLSMDLAGRHGGGCRPPRVALTAEQRATIGVDTERALGLEESARRARRRSG